MIDYRFPNDSLPSTFMDSIVMKCEKHFPTLLIVLEDGGLCSVLVGALQVEGYAALHASSKEEALGVVRTHSRHIHLLVTDDSVNSQALAAQLRQYRPQMDVLFLPLTARNGSWNPTAVDQALHQVRDIVVPPVALENPRPQTGRVLVKGA